MSQSAEASDQVKSEKISNSQSEKYEVFYEIFCTEEKYVNILIKLQEKIYPFLLTECEHNKKSNYPSKEEINGIFSPISPIFELHKNFVLSDLRQRNYEWKEKPYVADIFIKIFPFMKLYTSYLCILPKILTNIEVLTKKFSKFSGSLCSFTNDDPLFDFSSALIEPIQRMTKYKLLLQNYEKLMSNDDTEKEEIQKANDSVTKVAEHCEKAIVQLKRQTKLSDIANQFNSPISILLPEREFIMEDKIKLNTKLELSKMKTYKAFLFNDAIIFATKGWKNKYEIASEVKVEAIDAVVEYHSSDGKLEHAFIIELRNSAYYIIPSVDHMRSRWIESIKKAMECSKVIKSHLISSPRLSVIERHTSINFQDIDELNDRKSKFKNPEVQKACSMQQKFIHNNLEGNM